MSFKVQKSGPHVNIALYLRFCHRWRDLRAEEVCKVVRDALRLGGGQPWVVSADMMKLLLPIPGGTGNDFTMKPLA